MTDSNKNHRRKLGRIYPPKPERGKIRSRIEAIPEALRSPKDWYTLGSLLIYEATLDEDDVTLNRGTDAPYRSYVYQLLAREKARTKS